MHFNAPRPSIHAINITHECMEKISQLILQCSTEIGWFCLVTDRNDGPTLFDVIVLDQRVSPITTEIDEYAIAKFCQYTMETPNGVETINAMRCWGHSHVHMATNPSGQDQTQMNSFAKQYKPDKTYRLIGNKQGHLRIDIYGPDGNCQQQDVGFYLTGTTITEKQQKEYAAWAKHHITQYCHSMNWRHPEAPKVVAMFPASPYITPQENQKNQAQTRVKETQQETTKTTKTTPWWRSLWTRLIG